MADPLSYAVHVRWSDEDGCYVARAPAFAGLGANGGTPEEAREALCIAIGAAIDVLRKLGRPVPKADGSGSRGA